MRGSMLEKIEEENNSSVEVNDQTIRETIYTNRLNDGEISRDSYILQNTNDNYISRAQIFPSNPHLPNAEGENTLLESKRYSKGVGKIEIVKSQKEFKNIRNNSSFFEGKPRTEEDIVKLECPLYRCERNTIIRSHLSKDYIESKRENIENLGTGVPELTLTKDEKNINLTKHKRRAAIVDIRLANTMEIRTFRSLFMTILQIINCIIRYTIVQFPFCIRWLGLVYGPIIISVIGAMSIYSIYMLIKVKQVTAFAYEWIGMNGKICILILNCLSSFGSCLSYIIIFLKVIPNLVTIGTGETFLANKTLLSIILSMWLLLYCYQKDVSGIKGAAYWGVLGIVSFLLLDIANMLIWSWYEYIPEDRNMNYISIQFNEFDVYSSIATIILSFSFHTYTFSIYDCIDNPDSRKMIVTSSIGIFTSTLIYLLVGTIGYILYGNKITDSILDTMGYSNISILMSISFVINVVMSFPITFSSLKHYFIFLIEIILTMFKHMCSKKKVNKEKLLTSSNNTLKKESEDEEENEAISEEESEEEGHHGHSSHHDMVRLPEYIEYMIVFGLFVLIFYTAIQFPNIKIIFGLLGATTANLFSFILPAMFFMKFAKNKFFSLTKILALLFIIVGLLGLVVCLTSNILSLMKGDHH